MSFWLKAWSFLIIIAIGILASAQLTIGLGAKLRDAIDEYPSTATRISLFGVSEEKSVKLLAVLSSFAGGENHAVVRVDRAMNPADGSTMGTQLGIATPTDTPNGQLKLSLLGTDLVSLPQITDLMTSSPTASIGLFANSADVISDIPHLAFAPRISVVKLSQLVNASGTINGTYRIVGASPLELEDLLNRLEAESGLARTNLLHPLRGEYIESGMAGPILFGAMLAASAILLMILLVESVRSFRVLGVHMLLGKSTWKFAGGLFAPVAISIIVAAILSMITTILLTQGYQLNISLLSAAWSGAMVGALFPIVGTVIACAVIVTVKPVNAILERYSKKLFLAALSVTYVATMAALVTTLIYIDGPIKETARLGGIAQAWSSVGDQRILYRHSIGHDQASFARQSKQLATDYYNWYTSIANQSGVTMVNTYYTDQKTLDNLATNFPHVPEQPYWWFTASPSYLASQGFSVDPAVVDQADLGQRIFLIPSTWSESAQSAMRAWLTDRSHISYEPSIRTKYFEKQIIRFVSYTPDKELFAWNADPAQQQTTTDPVILLSTPANMIPSESESLYAVGLTNSYIKLTETAQASYASPEYFAKYHLDDNNVEFLPVREFVAGLTKSIEDVIMLFSTLLLILGGMCIITLVTLARLFTSMHRESLAIKRMIGYSITRLFAAPIILVSCFCVLAMTIAMILMARSALIGSAIMLIVQLVLLIGIARGVLRYQLSTTLKE